jgi:hypothetical protein
MRKQPSRPVSLLGITFMSLVFAPGLQADDTHRNRDHGRNNAHARQHEREQARHEAQHERNRNREYRNRDPYGYGANRDPYYSNRDPYNNRAGTYDRYSRGTYGTRGSGTVVDRALNNLNVAASNSRADGHERGHFNKAQQELSNFQYRWAQGQFDTGRLDNAVNAIEHLVNSDQLNNRDRSVLANDLAALRQFRNSGGRGGYYAPLYQNR